MSFIELQTLVTGLRLPIVYLSPYLHAGYCTRHCGKSDQITVLPNTSQSKMWVKGFPQAPGWLLAGTSSCSDSKPPYPTGGVSPVGSTLITTHLTLVISGKPDLSHPNWRISHARASHTVDRRGQADTPLSDIIYPPQYLGKKRVWGRLGRSWSRDVLMCKGIRMSVNGSAVSPICGS